MAQSSDMPRWPTLEGEDDELVLIGEVLWHNNPSIFVKINSSFGLTEKAPDFAPEVGIMFVFLIIYQYSRIYTGEILYVFSIQNNRYFRCNSILPSYRGMDRRPYHKNG
jgi:hypothetical protein